MKGLSTWTISQNEKISSRHEKSFRFKKLIGSVVDVTLDQKQTRFECEIQNPMIIYARFNFTMLHSIRTKPYLIVRSINRFMANALQFHTLSLCLFLTLALALSFSNVMNSQLICVHKSALPEVNSLDEAFDSKMWFSSLDFSTCQSGVYHINCSWGCGRNGTGGRITSEKQKYRARSS